MKRGNQLVAVYLFLFTSFSIPIMKLRLNLSLRAALMACYAMATPLACTLFAGSLALTSHAYATDEEEEDTTDETAAAIVDAEEEVSYDLGNVMFVGDSITHGAKQISYRWDFHKILVDNGLIYNSIGIMQDDYYSYSQSPDSYGGVEFTNVHNAESGATAETISGSSTTAKFGGSNIYNWLGLSDTMADGDEYVVGDTESVTGSYGEATFDVFSDDVEGSVGSPDLYIMMIGTNDVSTDWNSWDGVSSVTTVSGVAEQIEYMDLIYAALMEANADCVILISTIPVWPIDSTWKTNITSTGRSVVSAYNEYLFEWAESKDNDNLIVVDVNEGMYDITLGDGKTYGLDDMYDDGLHTSYQGNLIAAGNYAKALGYAGGTAGQYRESETEFKTNFYTSTGSVDFVSAANVESKGIVMTNTTVTSASIQLGGNGTTSTLYYAWQDGEGLDNGATVDFDFSLGNGSEDGWNTTDYLTIIMGNDSYVGVLTIDEAFISWDGSILYSIDMSTDLDNLRIAWVNGEESAGLESGFYIWLDDMMIGEALSGTSGSYAEYDGVTFIYSGDSEVYIYELSIDGTQSYAPTTEGITNEEDAYYAVADNPDGPSSSDLVWNSDGSVVWTTDEATSLTASGGDYGASDQIAGDLGDVSIVLDAGSATANRIYGSYGSHTGNIWVEINEGAIANSTVAWYAAHGSGSSSTGGSWELNGNVMLKFTGDATGSQVNEDGSLTGSGATVLGAINGGTVTGSVYLEFSAENLHLGNGYSGFGASVAGTYNSDVNGDMHMVFNAGVFENAIYGGTIGTIANTIGGATYISINGGTFNGNVYGGGSIGSIGTGLLSSASSATNVTVTAGTINASVYGGGTGGTISGGTTVSLTGGTITGDVYGGGTGGTIAGSTTVTIEGSDVVLHDGTSWGTVTAGSTAGTISGNSTLSIKNVTNSDNEYGFDKFAGTLSGGTVTTGTRELILDDVVVDNFAAKIENFDTISLYSGTYITLTNTAGVTVSTLNLDVDLGLTIAEGVSFTVDKLSTVYVNYDDCDIINYGAFSFTEATTFKMSDLDDVFSGTGVVNLNGVWDIGDATTDGTTLATFGDNTVNLSDGLVLDLITGLDNGTYALFSAAEVTGLDAAYAVNGLSDDQVFSLSYDTETGLLMIVIAEDTGLTWSTGDAVWSSSSIATTDGESSDFARGGRITFDAVGGTISLNGDVQAGSITFNDNLDFTLDGDGSLIGDASLVKNGDGTLTLSTSNSYTGDTIINSGILVLDAADAAGSSKITINDGTTLQINNADAMGSATIAYAGGTIGFGTTMGFDVSAITSYTASSLDFDLSNDAIVTLSNASSISSQVLKVTGEGELIHDAWASITSVYVDSDAAVTFSGSSAASGTNKTISGTGTVTFDNSQTAFGIYVSFDDFTGTLVVDGTSGIVFSSNTSATRFALEVNDSTRGAILQYGSTTTYLYALSGTGMISATNSTSVRHLDLEMIEDNTFSGEFYSADSSNRLGTIYISSTTGKHFTFTLDGTGWTTDKTGTTTGSAGLLYVSNADVIITESAQWQGAINLVDADSTLIYQDLDAAYERLSTAGIIFGSGSVEIDGSDVTFSGSNTYAGGTSLVNSATLTTGAAGTLSTGAIAIESGSSLNLNVADELSNTLSGAGTINVNADVTLSGTDGSFTGTTNVAADTSLTLASSTAIAGTINLSGGLVLDAAYSGTVAVSTTGATISTTSDDSVATIGALTMTSTSSLAIEDGTTLSVTGTASFSGATVTGDLDITGNVSVTGATTFKGDVQSDGYLNFTAALTFDGGESEFDYMTINNSSVLNLINGAQFTLSEDTAYSYEKHLTVNLSADSSFESHTTTRIQGGSDWYFNGDSETQTGGTVLFDDGLIISQNGTSGTTLTIGQYVTMTVNETLTIGASSGTNAELIINGDLISNAVLGNTGSVSGTVSVNSTGSLTLNQGLTALVTTGLYLNVEGSLIVSTGSAVSSVDTFYVTMNDDSTLIGNDSSGTTTVYQAISYAENATVTFDGGTYTDESTTETMAASLVMNSNVSGTNVSATIEGNVSFAGGATLTGITMDENAILTISSDVTTSSLASDDATASVIVASGGNFTLGSTSGYTGSLILNGGTLISSTGTLDANIIVSADSSLSSSTSSLELNSTITITDAAYSLDLTGAGHITVGDDFSLVLDYTLEYGTDYTIFTGVSSDISADITNISNDSFDSTLFEYTWDYDENNNIVLSLTAIASEPVWNEETGEASIPDASTSDSDFTFNADENTSTESATINTGSTGEDDVTGTTATGNVVVTGDAEVTIAGDNNLESSGTITVGDAAKSTEVIITTGVSADDGIVVDNGSVTVKDDGAITDTKVTLAEDTTLSAGNITVTGVDSTTSVEGTVTADELSAAVTNATVVVAGDAALAGGTIDAESSLDVTNGTLTMDSSSKVEANTTIADGAAISGTSITVSATGSDASITMGDSGSLTDVSLENATVFDADISMSEGATIVNATLDATAITLESGKSIEFTNVTIGADTSISVAAAQAAAVQTYFSLKGDSSATYDAILADSSINASTAGGSLDIDGTSYTISNLDVSSASVTGSLTINILLTDVELVALQENLANADTDTEFAFVIACLTNVDEMDSVEININTVDGNVYSFAGDSVSTTNSKLVISVSADSIPEPSTSALSLLALAGLLARRRRRD